MAKTPTKTPTQQKALVLTKAALAAAVETARTFGPAGEKKGDVCLKGNTRRAVVKAAVAALSDKEQDKLIASDNASIHRWIGGVLKHSGCLIETVEGYLESVNELGALDTHAPSVIGPESIRRHIAAERKAKEPKPEKEASKPKAKTAPPKKAKKTPPSNT